MPGKTQRKKSNKSTRAYSGAKSGAKKRAGKSSGKNVRSGSDRKNSSKTLTLKKKRRQKEFTGILIIAFGILCALSIYNKNLTGLFGEIILHITTGLFGLVAYFLPPYS